MSFSYIQSPAFRYVKRKADPYVTSLAEWIESEYQPKDYDLAILGVPLSRSSITLSNAFLHPQKVRELFANFSTYNMEEDVDLAPMSVLDVGDVKMHITDVSICHEHIEKAILELKEKLPSALPIMLGGDHSITFPILKGLQQHYAGKRIGLIQFDAHLDVRDTEYGGRSNGTPIRSCIENEVIRGEDIVTIGLRSFANSKAYRDYAVDKGMSLYTSRDVKQQGMNTILEKELARLSSTCDYIYVTFDVDVLDQSLVPAVPAIGPNGLSGEDLFYAARLLGEHKQVIGMDMVCVDPSRDLRDVTSRVSVHFMLYFMSGVFQQKQQ